MIRSASGVISVAFAKSGKPFTKIVSRSNAIPTGKYPSWKTNRMHQWQSIGERNAFKILDACASVCSYEHQFVEIVFALNGIVYKHYPDIFVRRRMSEEIIEVKTLQYALDPFIRARTALLQRLLPQYGYAYRLFISSHISREPRLSTVTKLNQLSRCEISILDKERLRRALNNESFLRWGDVSNGKFGERGRCHIARMILEGNLEINLDEELSEYSLIKIPTKPQNDDELYLDACQSQEYESLAAINNARVGGQLWPSSRLDNVI